MDEITLNQPLTKEVEIPEVLTTEQLQAMIRQLSATEDGDSLRGEMDELKRALRANPAACASLLPDDIGQMVDALMKVTGKEIEEDMADKRKTKGSTAKVKLDLSDPKVRQEIADDLF